jgi:hypothetical protein
MSSTTVPATVVVETKSAWFSKINWAQAIGVGAMAVTLVTGGKTNVPLEVQTAIIAAITAIQAAVTIVLRTWFTTTIVPASLPTTPPPPPAPPLSTIRR